MLGRNAISDGLALKNISDSLSDAFLTANTADSSFFRIAFKTGIKVKSGYYPAFHFISLLGNECICEERIYSSQAPEANYFLIPSLSIIAR